MIITVAAFYKFVAIEDAEALRTDLLSACQVHGIRGTILIAGEGINATVSGTAEAMDALLSKLRSDPRFSDLAVKVSYTSDHPFQRTKVKVKREIITFGVPEADPSKQIGTYVAPEDWNALISDPAVVLIDTRNSYEAKIGTFDRAVDPGTRSFSELPKFFDDNLDPQKTPKVAMFCTGGIRCEKASAYLLAHGIPQVYHLQGGILNYLEKVPAEDSLWRGECFVFDERVALQHGCTEGLHRMCKSCGTPMLVADEDADADVSDVQCELCRAAA